MTDGQSRTPLLDLRQTAKAVSFAALILSPQAGLAAGGNIQIYAEFLIPPQILRQAQVQGPSIGVEHTGPVAVEDNLTRDDDVSVQAAEIASEPELKIAIKILRDGGDSCRSVGDAYVVDCIAKHLRAAANSMPAGRAFGETRTTLNQAALELEQLVTENSDPEQPRIRVSMATPLRDTTPPLRATRPETAVNVKAQALAVLDEAETVLLRSADASRGRATHFQRIADAIDSNKVLLRS